MNEMLFNELSLEWLAYKKCSIKISTYARYTRVVLKNIDPILGLIKCRELNEHDIILFVNSLSLKNMSSKSIQDIVVIVKAIIKYGNMMGVTHVILNLIPCPKVVVKKMEVLSLIQIQKLNQYLLRHPSSKNIGIILSLYGGMRLGEICALTWDDIDLENNKIIVNKTMQRIYIDEYNTKVIISNPKTESSSREIPICSFLKEQLLMMDYKDGFVLRGTKGKYVEPKVLQNHFKKIIKEIGECEFSFHILRHTFATQCIQCDVDVKSLSEILGHSSVNITLNRYVHSSFHTKMKQIAKLTYE